MLRVTGNYSADPESEQMEVLTVLDQAGLAGHTACQSLKPPFSPKGISEFTGTNVWG